MNAPVGISIPHDSASKHVSGQALYIDDMPEPRVLPLELLTQLTPLARTIRERSRMSGELIVEQLGGRGGIAGIGAAALLLDWFLPRT